MARAVRVWHGGARMSPRARAALVALVLAATVPAAADPPAPTPSREPAVDDADLLDLARLADRRGDGAVLATIADETATVRARLRAIRAASFLDAPELALEPLARVAHGRDPQLAPAAAVVVYRIADRLSAPAVEANETVASLESAAETLALVRDDESARPDLRRLAAFAVASIEALSRPPGE